MLSVLVMGLVVMPLQAPAAPPDAPVQRRSAFWATSPPPEKCVVILDDMGDVGFRIAESQMLAESVGAAMLKRVGYGGMVYEGVKTHARKIKGMMGTHASTELQTDQLTYYALAEKNAKYRMRVRFKRVGRGKKVRERVTLTCRKAGASSKDNLEKKVLEAKTFREVRGQVEEAIYTFCKPLPALQKGPSGPAIPPGDVTPGSEKRRQKKLKDWAPPPPRH